MISGSDEEMDSGASENSLSSLEYDVKYLTIECFFQYSIVI